MNDISNPALPPMLPHDDGPRLLGEDPAERDPISGVIAAFEAILRQPRRVMFQLKQSGAGKLIAAMIVVSLVCSVVYGVVMGTFSMGMQLWAAPLKISLGLLISGLICLPSLYIFACLSGSQARLSEVTGLLTGLLMLMTVLLLGFAPVAWVFSQSTESVTGMGTLHLIFWCIATAFGLRFFERGFGHTSARSLAGFRTWVIIFMLVILQMATALRPIVGAGEKTTFLPTEKKFFLTHWGESLNSSDSSRGNPR
jgi:hypothetical protein